MNERANTRSTIGLFTDALSQIALLFQTEMRLVRAELSEKLNQVLGHAATVGVGLVFVLAALILLLQSVVSWLEVAGLPDEWGYLLVGLAVAAIGAVLLTKGINALKETSVVPDRAVNQVRADLATVKEHIQ
ncbi:MAG TPA: phage holin family protein [Bauldia sp.]|nr:phage holin family protein [Bauldia sp.]